MAGHWWEMRAKLLPANKIKTRLIKGLEQQIMSVCGRGLSGAAFRGSRLPLIPRTNTGPYVRPIGPTRLPSQTRRNTGDDDQTASRPTLEEILDEVRREIGTLLNLFSDNLYARILGKQVMQQEARNNHKFNQAKTFCCKRLTDFRCEERRRLFGIPPYRAFPKLTTAEFAGSFLMMIKAADEGEPTSDIWHYWTFARRCPGARCDTFKKFQEWLNITFTNGFPTDEEWDAIMAEDEQYEYHLETLDGRYDGTQEGCLNLVGAQGGA